MATEAEILKMTKPQLADLLVGRGVVYPNRPGILRWSKDELQREAIEVCAARTAPGNVDNEEPPE